MSLIDANELMKLIPPEEMMSKLAIANAPTVETCAYWDRESNFCALHRPSAQPTVEAIPIEWIKGWLASIKDNERYKNAYVQIENEVCRVAHNEMVFNIPSVSDMLEDWEKEKQK